ncbi:MAG: ATP-binding protein [Polyangiaceae bacterium]|jgi:DNA replication protein DnaC|nr:ATP-binding protein [Polyangiaceae bacterium]
MSTDILTLHRTAARLQARLMGNALCASPDAVRALMTEPLRALVPVLHSLADVIADSTYKRRRSEPHSAIEPPPQRALHPSKVDPFLPRVEALLSSIRISPLNVSTRFSTTKDSLAAIRQSRRRSVGFDRSPSPSPSPSKATPIYDPGQMAECDWSPSDDVPFTDGTTWELQAFGYTLVNSRRKHFAFFVKSDLHALMDGHLQAFERFQRLAKECKYDSQKPVVLRWEGMQPIFNPRFIAFATYYEFKPHALRGNPNGKPRVERSFWELVRSFFNGRSLRNMDDLNEQLARLGFVQRRDDLVITGQPGTGKSHFLKAFALRACQQGIRVRYARCVDLLDDLHAGLADHSYPRRLRAWSTPDLIIIDDVGLGQVRKRDDAPTAAHSLFNLIDRRHGRVSTAVTSNIKLSEWGKYLGDATVAGAILDRLAMHGIRLDINGPSYRKHLADERAKNAGTPSLLDDIEA